MPYVLRTLCAAETTDQAVRRVRRSLWLLAVLALTACGGGGGPSTGKVVVTVRDVIQAPVAGARVYLRTYDSDQDAVANADGRAEFVNVPKNFSIHVYEPLPKNDSLALYALVSEQTVGAGEVKEVDIVASPYDFPAGGVAEASVAAGGLSDDGKTMQLVLKIMQVRALSERDYSAGSVRVLPCVPDTSNDLPEQRSDCVSGTDGFDAAYGEGEILSITGRAAGSAQATPYAAALLLDQSTSVIVDDPADTRLFAAKYFMTYASGDSPKALAAFASDAPGTAGVSLLPQQPLSLFPVENPQFSTDGPSYFPTIDALGTMEGGAAPLYSALSRALDFVAANSTGSAKAVAVISNGRDDTCGTKAQCRAARDEVIRKSQATDVAIVTIGVPSVHGEVDREALGLLAQSTPRGAAFWTQSPEQLAMTVSSAHSYLGLRKGLMEVTFQLQTSVAGAFASGRTVLGTITLEECPWECYYTHIPFVVKVP